MHFNSNFLQLLISLLQMENKQIRHRFITMINRGKTSTNKPLSKCLKYYNRTSIYVKTRNYGVLGGNLDKVNLIKYYLIATKFL